MEDVVFCLQAAWTVVFAVICLREITNCVDATMRYGVSVVTQSMRELIKAEHKKHAMAFKRFIIWLNAAPDKRAYISDHRLFVENFMQRVLGTKDDAMDVFFHCFCCGDTVQDKILHDLAETAVQSLMLCVESMCLVGCIHELSVYEDLVYSVAKFSATHVIFERQRLAAAQPHKQPSIAPSIQGTLE